MVVVASQERKLKIINSKYHHHHQPKENHYPNYEKDAILSIYLMERMVFFYMSRVFRKSYEFSPNTCEFPPFTREFAPFTRKYTHSPVN